MTLDEIKKAADLAREIEDLERKHKYLSTSCGSPRVSFAYTTGFAGFSYMNDSFSISKYEAMQFLENRIANFKADLKAMGVKL